MATAFSIGSRCALMLPKKLVNPHDTPAKGLVINQLIGKQSLVLVEEVWQFKGLGGKRISNICFTPNHLDPVNWGWQAVPEVVDEGEYIVIPTKQSDLREITTRVLERLIQRSVADFQEVHGFI